ncbi:MAG: sensor domain-containing diguanylate cyclase [Sphingobium sp.]
MADQRLTDEVGRLAALARYDILDSPPESGFDRITGLVRSVLNVPMAVVSLVDADRQWFKAHDGLDDTETPRGIAFCDHTIRQREPMVIADATADARFSDNPLVTGGARIRSYAGVPLTTPDGYNIGSLCAIDTVPRDFDPAQIAILQSLAALVVDQMELRRIADRDFLTDALTRRAFVAEMDKRIALFLRHARPAGLLLFDIDRFKAVNDSHGHAAGDAVIRAVALLCDRLKRPSDVLGRLGGEEFGLLLPETSETEAMTAAERFRAAIAALHVDHAPPLRVTVSFGVAALDHGRCRSDAWIAEADAALYAAKRSGRDRVNLARLSVPHVA